jgi:ABC-2 type transport system permease protein
MRIGSEKFWILQERRRCCASTPGLERAVNSGQTATVQLLVHGADSNTGGVILSYASKIVHKYSQELMESRLARAQGVVEHPWKVELQSRAWYNENLESRHYSVPGVMATIVTLISLLLTAMAIVREKEPGTIEQVLATPIRSGEFVLGRTIPFALISFVDVILVIVVGTLWLGIPIRGNPLRHFLVVIGGVFLKGVGLDVLWPQMLALALLGVFTLTVTVKRFHKTLS